MVALAKILFIREIRIRIELVLSCENLINMKYHSSLDGPEAVEEPYTKVKSIDTIIMFVKILPASRVSNRVIGHSASSTCTFLSLSLYGFCVCIFDCRHSFECSTKSFFVVV